MLRNLHPYTLSPIPSSARKLPGKITREAPPGAGMTEDEFKNAMENLAIDAKRWRWIQRNLGFMLAYPLETWTGAQLGRWIDENIEQSR